MITLESMADELESIKGEMSEVKTMVKDIHILLAGNPIDRDAGGLLSEIRTMRAEVDEIRDQLRKYKAYFYALVSLISMGALKVIVEFFVNK